MTSIETLVDRLLSTVRTQPEAFNRVDSERDVSATVRGWKKRAWMTEHQRHELSRRRKSIEIEKRILAKVVAVIDALEDAKSDPYLSQSLALNPLRNGPVAMQTFARQLEVDIAAAESLLIPDPQNDPAVRLVVAAATVFEKHFGRPGTTPNGPFARFCEALFAESDILPEGVPSPTATRSISGATAVKTLQDLRTQERDDKGSLEAGSKRRGTLENQKD